MADAPSAPNSPWRKSPLHSSGDASRLTALFVGYICPMRAAASPSPADRVVSLSRNCRAAVVETPTSAPQRLVSMGTTPPSSSNEPGRRRCRKLRPRGEGGNEPAVFRGVEASGSARPAPGVEYSGIHNMRIEKQKRQRARIPHCRMYLRKELGWLPGFPLGQGHGRVSWMPAPQLGAKGAGPLELDAEHLRRAASAWTMLVRDFPRALPQVVAELDRWKERVPQILGWLTDAIHRGEPLPPLAVDDAIPPAVAAHAERLAALRPALRPLLSATSWIGSLASTELPGTLEWVEVNADAVEGILAAQPEPAGVISILTLSALANEDEPSRSNLLRIAAPRGPGSLVRVEVLEFATWIGAQIPPVRRRALRLLGLALYDGLVDEKPRHLRIALQRFKAAVAKENADFYREMLRLLDHLPLANDARFRFSFLNRWCRVLEAYPPRRVVLLLREVYRYLSRRPGSALDPWLHQEEGEFDWISGLLRPPTEEDDDDERDPTEGESKAAFRGRCQTTFHTLDSCIKRPVTDVDGFLIVNLALATNNAGDACRCFQQLDEAGLREYIDFDTLRLALELDTQAELFGTLVSELRYDSHNRLSRHRLSLLRVMNRCLVQAGWTGTTAALIADRQIALLSSCAERWAVAEALRVSVEPDPRRVETMPVWAQRYPETLQSALGELAGVTGDAERIASGVLAKDFPHPTDLQQEIAALEEQVAARRDRRRLERLGSLRGRLRSPRPVSSVRIDRLRGKLEARTRRCLIESWCRRLDAALTAQFSRLLQTDEVPAWMFEPPQLRVLASMMSLSDPFRSLGWRLLRARASSPPWYLVDDPANRAYLARVRALGVNVAPWLNPRSRSCVGENGCKVELDFEWDPLKIFQMGWHFGTCLSPEYETFFSVFVIAADVNKHVVYARDATRTVVGRCLLALDDGGGLITFHPYCHDQKLGFDKMIGKLAKELAGEMKTHVVKRGTRTVPCLVAPRWHDDGPGRRSRIGIYSILDEHSELSKFLSRLVARGEFVAYLEKQFAPMPLNGYALSLVLEMYEFDARPGLIRPLLPLLDRCEELDYRTCMRAASIAAAAGESDFVRRVLRKRGVRYVLQRRGSQLDEKLMLMLMEHDPSATIRLVRATRDRHVRSDEEDEEQRRLYLARAYELLDRPARARRMQAADAQCRLGHQYREGGASIARNASAAFKWYRRAAEQGHVEGQYWLGVMYRDGRGVPRDLAEGARWIQRAAEQGNREAQFMHGVNCEFGKGVQVDLAAAAAWYRRAAEQDVFNAYFELARMYYEGLGVERNYAQAVHWYRRGGAVGDANTGRWIGDRFATGRGAPRDLAEAAHWYRRAADMGNAGAQCKLGDLLATGRGVARDAAAALRRYREAAEQGHGEAQFNLGNIYAAGSSVPRDLAKAAHWYRKAAESRKWWRVIGYEDDWFGSSRATPLAFL